MGEYGIILFIRKAHYYVLIISFCADITRPTIMANMVICLTVLSARSIHLDELCCL